MGTLRFEHYQHPNHGPAYRETLREYVNRHLRSTGSAFKWAQRRCNYGLTTAEWNELSYEQRDALNRCAHALYPRRTRVR